jgi:hypothetical protein
MSIPNWIETEIIMSTIKYAVASLAMTASLAAPATAGATAQTAQTANCLDSTKPYSYITSFTHGTGTISTRDGRALCQSANLSLESFTMPDTWDGKGFNSTAIPQTKYALVHFTMPAGQANVSKTLNIGVPADCKNTQIDFYKGNGFDKLTGVNDDDAAFIGGIIFKRNGVCLTATPTPAVTPKPTTTPTPVVTPTPTRVVPVATPSVLGASTSTTTLPDTGTEGLVNAFGLTAIIGTAGVYLKQRFGRK